MNSLWNDIQKMCEENYIEEFDTIGQLLHQLEQQMLLLTQQDRQNKIDELERIAKNANASIKYLIYTFLLKVVKEPKYLRYIYEEAQRDESLTKENKFFLYYQLVAEAFQDEKEENEELQLKCNLFYQSIYKQYEQQFIEKLTPIPPQQQKENVVIVFINQFLDMGHGPTKTALDRCYVLSKKMNKQVWLINTAEFMSDVGIVPIYKGYGANYRDEWCDQTQITYKGQVFRFFQCANCMPNDMEIGNIIDFVRKVSPSLIVHIGGESMVMDLCDKLVPGMVINTVHSKLTRTESAYQLIGRNITEQEKNILCKIGKSEKHVIECRFTFALREQERTYTRAELGIPEDKFVVIIVGGRLDWEIKADFVHMLSNLMTQGMFVVFMGKFEKYSQWCEQEEIWKDNSKYLGFMSDVLAVNECCDLYLNPIRTGGGTSIVEAFYKGLPAISCPVGDVSLGAGEEFMVADYEEMEAMAVRYATDKSFYEEKSKKARQRAAYLMDSESVFPEALEEMRKRQRISHAEI